MLLTMILLQRLWFSSARMNLFRLRAGTRGSSSNVPAVVVNSRRQFSTDATPEFASSGAHHWLMSSADLLASACASL